MKHLDDIALSPFTREAKQSYFIFGKEQHRLDNGSNVSCVNQPTNLDQVLQVGFNHKPGKMCFMALCYNSRKAWMMTETSTPPGFTTCQECCKMSPPSVSKTTSTL